MKYFKIGRSYGYAGTEDHAYIMAETLEEAEDEAWEFALENVDSWAEEISEESFKSRSKDNEP